jgi:hypothetical protein
VDGAWIGALIGAGSVLPGGTSSSLISAPSSLGHSGVRPGRLQP